MTTEEKQLLLKDLSARVPYGVVAQVIYKDGEGWKTEDRKVLGVYTDGQVYANCVYTNIENTKPYLRPMSSMTEEEKKEFDDFCVIDVFVWEGNVEIGYKNQANIMSGGIDWLLKHHFDFRGLIPMGLALEALDWMYKEG